MSSSPHPQLLEKMSWQKQTFLCQSQFVLTFRLCWEPVLLLLKLMSNTNQHQPTWWKTSQKWNWAWEFRQVSRKNCLSLDFYYEKESGFLLFGSGLLSYTKQVLKFSLLSLSNLVCNTGFSQLSCKIILMCLERICKINTTLCTYNKFICTLFEKKLLSSVYSYGIYMCSFSYQKNTARGENIEPMHKSLSWQVKSPIFYQPMMLFIRNQVTDCEMQIRIQKFWQ